MKKRCVKVIYQKSQPEPAKKLVKVVYAAREPQKPATYIVVMTREDRQ